MKRCPQCNRVETDDSLVFCRTDGASLVSDSLPLHGEAGTARLGPTATEIETSILPHATAVNVSRSNWTNYCTAPSNDCERDARNNKAKA
ncbi:MAG: hypothetical protein ND866_22290 [Pyrinomonadaceae bacterium]|nr:hypothetical protein [Pyrinomonadaceae bacterium]